MKNHGFVVRSGLIGASVHIDVNTSHGPNIGQTLIHLAGYGDVIGCTLRGDVRSWLPVVYETSGAEVELRPASTRHDAIRDVIAHLADAGDERLDLQWREVVW